MPFHGIRYLHVRSFFLNQLSSEKHFRQNFSQECQFCFHQNVCKLCRVHLVVLCFKHTCAGATITDMLTLHSCVPAFINAVHCSMDSVISWRKLYLQLFHPKILKFRKNLIVKQVLEASTEMCFLKIDVPNLEIDGGTFNSNFTNK